MPTQPDSTGSHPVSALRQDSETGLFFRVREPLSAKPKAGVILLHGVGGNETNLLEVAHALDPEVLVVLPRGPLQFAPGQYGWFRVAFSANGPQIDPVEAEASRKTLIGFIAQLEAIYGVPAGNTLIAGFSQGGIMSASVALSAPEQVCGFGILSGRILPELAAQLASRERLAVLQAFISHGEFDNTLPVSWAQRAEQWLAELGVAFESERYPAGHTLTAAMQADFIAWTHGRIATRSEKKKGSVWVNCCAGLC